MEIGVSIEPVTGKFSLSGTLKNLVRHKRHLIIHTRTAKIAQWVFQKTYLRDNFQIDLDLLLICQHTPTAEEALICEVKAQDGGRLVRATRKKVALVGN